MTTETISYNVPGNFTYDSDDSVIDGEFYCRDQREIVGDGDLMFYVPYTTDQNALYFLDSGAGTLYGGSVAAGVLNLDGGIANGAVVHSNANDFTSLIYEMSIVVDYTPNYTGNPAANRFLWCLSTGATTNNNITLYQNTGSTLLALAYNSTGGNILNANFGVYSFTAGNTYRMQFNFTSSAGATGLADLYIDEVRQGTQKTVSAGTRTAITQFVVGNQETRAGTTDGSFDNVCLFPTYQSTLVGASQSYPQTIYLTTGPSALPNATVKATALESISVTETVAGSDLNKYTVNVDGTDYYSNSGVKTASDLSVAQSNTLAEINTNASIFVTSRSDLTIRALSVSDDGSTTPRLDQLIYTYDKALDNPTTPGTFDLEGFLYCTNVATANQSVKIRPYQTGWINEGVFQCYKYYSIGTTDSSGFFEGDDLLIPPSGEQYEIKIGPQSYTMTFTATGLPLDADSISDGDTIDMSDLTFTAVS